MARWILAFGMCVYGATAGTAAANEADAGVDNAAARARLAEWVPVGHADNNSCARGLAAVLEFLGHDVDYDTIMGDSGQAFIAQGEEDSTNLIDGAVDVGWWPLEPVGMTIRLDFLEKAVGRELRDVLPSHEAGGYVAYRDDPAAYYRKWLAPVVDDSLSRGMPGIAQHGTWFVVTDVDDGDPPVIGAWACGAEREIVRLTDGYPYNLLVPGDTTRQLDRTTADAEALRYAVALHRDEVLAPSTPDGSRYTVRHAEYGERWRTGVKTYAAWIEALEDAENLGQARWHRNVVYQLGINRRSAIRYLDAMSERHPESVATHLGAAARSYEAVVRALEGVDLSEDAIASAAGRGALAGVIEEIVELESQAAAEMESAAQALN
ncbi:hypothetical protein CMK11_18970 [Candidatus Poribacteria bacterium]|nr:hypothetical protein [Candidatus Poribacteria bacterium]